VKNKNIEIECGYRIDMLVGDSVTSELNSIEGPRPVDETQILTCMKPINNAVGLSFNLNFSKVKEQSRDTVYRFFSP
jgi:GxxExxY protein